MAVVLLSAAMIAAVLLAVMGVGRASKGHCPARNRRDHVLLQHSRAGLLGRIEPTCDTCVRLFVEHGGCEAMDETDYSRLEELLHVPELSGCVELDCGDQTTAQCSTAAAKEPSASPANEGEAESVGSGPEACKAACAPAFDSAGGCAALRAGDFMLVEELMDSPELVACHAGCKDIVLEHCYPKLAGHSCHQCAAKVERAGACEALTNAFALDQLDKVSSDDFAQYMPSGCAPCGGDAVVHCLARQSETNISNPVDCGQCFQALNAGDWCSRLRRSGAQGSDPVSAPAQCLGDAGRCIEEFAERCFADMARICHTARPGETCYRHVRWAMQIGIVVYPSWYPELAIEANFEDFQRHVQNHTYHRGCPLPCDSLPMSACHTAVSSEKCHKHVTWAMQHGIKLFPSWYPTLTKLSPFESFQGWLHHLHYGDCEKPCSTMGA